MMKPISWRLGGGINLVRPAIIRHRRPGELIGCMNYEARDEGYRRISGYERFDGRKAPSNIFDDPVGDEDTLAEERRAVITPVPGAKLLAVWRYRDRTYAFSADTAGDVSMYGSSTSGWQLIELGWRVAFTAGTGTAPAHGESIAAGSASGTVVGNYLTSGAWAAGNAAGEIVFTYEDANRFAASDSVTVEADNARTFTMSAVPGQQSVGTGSAFRFITHNFFGLGDRERMYGVSGTGKPWEYNGTMFLELDTGVTSSSPSRLAVHENHLFVGYPEGSAVWSDIGNPREFDATAGGAGETAIGDTLAEFVSGYKNTLFVFGRNSTHFLTGTSAADFRLQRLSDEAGAMPNTAVLMDQPTVYDDRGLRNVASTDEFGDFDVATISARIRPLLDAKRDGSALPVCSVRIRRKSQYRLFFSDGDCLVMSYVRRSGHISAEYTRFAYDVFNAIYDAEKPDADYGQRVGVLTSVCSVEDANGRERAFMTVQDSMFVYEMDRGKSFDSHPIPYYLRTPYNDFGTPFQVKRFKKLLVEVDSVYQSTFAVAADYDDEAQEGERGRFQTVSGPSSFWSEGDWGAGYWSQVPTRHAAVRIQGRGRNISVMLYARPAKVEEAHVVSGVTVYYDPRRLER